MGGAAKGRTDAEIADIENQHRPHGFARLPALGDQRSDALDAADGTIVVEGHRRVFRCRPYADQVRVHVIGVQDRKAQYFLLFRCRRLPADRTDKGGVLRVDQAHRHSLPLCMANGLGLGGLPRVRPDPDLPSRGPAKAVWRRASLGRSCAALSNLYIGRTLGCFPMLPSIRAASRSWLLTALTRRYARGR